MTPHDVAAAWHGDLPSPARVEETRAALSADRLYFEPDARYPGLFRLRPRHQVAACRRRQAAMERLGFLPGHLCIVRDVHGTPWPAVVFFVEELGFHAWMVGVNGTYHHAEDLLEIVAPWDFSHDPPDPGTEKVRLHHLVREARAVLRALAPAELAQTLRKLAQPASLDGLARALGSHLPGGHDSPVARLALAWRLNTSTEVFERVELEPDRAAYRPREQLPEKPGPDGETPARLEQNAALAEVDHIFPPDTGLYRRGTGHPVRSPSTSTFLWSP